MKNLDLKQKKIILIIVLIIVLIIYYYFSTKDSTDEIDSQNLEITNTENIEEKEEEKIVVHITGAVNKEGIVELETGARIADAIEKAGGSKENADIKNINLATILEDGMKIHIPTIEETNTNKDKTTENNENSQTITETIDNASDTKKTQGKVNINTANQQLRHQRDCRLDGKRQDRRHLLDDHGRVRHGGHNLLRAEFRRAEIRPDPALCARVRPDGVWSGRADQHRGAGVRAADFPDLHLRRGRDRERHADHSRSGPVLFYLCLCGGHLRHRARRGRFLLAHDHHLLRRVCGKNPVDPLCRAAVPHDRDARLGLSDLLGADERAFHYLLFAGRLAAPQHPQGRLCTGAAQTEKRGA